MTNSGSEHPPSIIRFIHCQERKKQRRNMMSKFTEILDPLDYVNTSSSTTIADVSLEDILAISPNTSSSSVSSVTTGSITQSSTSDTPGERQMSSKYGRPAHTAPGTRARPTSSSPESSSSSRAKASISKKLKRLTLRTEKKP
jgi:hypothetical protein